MLAKIGCSVGEIAAVTGCSPDTLQRRFAVVIKNGHEHRNCSLRRAQYDVAVNKKNATMLIWLGKQFLDQRDKLDTEHSGSIAIGTMQLDNADTDDLRQRLARAASLLLPEAP